MYEDMINYVKNILENTDSKATELKTVFPFRNRFEHSMRVYKWAKRINEVEKADEEVISIAAIFHDVAKGMNGGRNHAEAGAEICREYLRKVNYDINKSEMVVQAVRNHSSKDMPISELSLEDRVIIDADILDELGAITVLWDSIAVGMKEYPTYEKVYNRLVPVLQQEKTGYESLKTEYGKKLFKERIEFLETFLENLKYELGI